MEIVSVYLLTFRNVYDWLRLRQLQKPGVLYLFLAFLVIRQKMHN